MADRLLKMRGKDKFHSNNSVCPDDSASQVSTNIFAEEGEEAGGDSAARLFQQKQQLLAAQTKRDPTRSRSLPIRSNRSHESRDPNHRRVSDSRQSVRRFTASTESDEHVSTARSNHSRSGMVELIDKVPHIKTAPRVLRPDSNDHSSTSNSISIVKTACTAPKSLRSTKTFSVTDTTSGVPHIKREDSETSESRSSSGTRSHQEISTVHNGSGLRSVSRSTSRSKACENDSKLSKSSRRVSGHHTDKVLVWTSERNGSSRLGEVRWDDVDDAYSVLVHDCGPVGSRSQMEDEVLAIIMHEGPEHCRIGHR